MSILEREKEKTRDNILRYFAVNKNGKYFVSIGGKVPIKIVKILKGDYKIYSVDYNGRTEKRAVYHNYNDFEKFIRGWIWVKKN